MTLLVLYGFDFLILGGHRIGSSHGIASMFICFLLSMLIYIIHRAMRTESHKNFFRYYGFIIAYMGMVILGGLIYFYVMKSPRIFYLTLAVNVLMVGFSMGLFVWKFK